MAGVGGKREGAGRKKGVPNKLNADIKAMILGALHDAGGQAYLARQAIETPGPFLTLIGKVLPMQVTGENGKALAIDFRWADALPAERDDDALEVSGGATLLTFANADERST
jgi:hypothetical protein